ncbi:MAG: hypothetical protein AMDU3_IPLC00004G0109 [Thermoplasmatales archaeon I-plasma]|jgi:Uncharacterized conserved protein, COG5649|nr:MAG: hypothetical protein AMDU3_IPLC00004G0109 [Thermoplasmatales archaeon I-plasma]
MHRNGKRKTQSSMKTVDINGKKPEYSAVSYDETHRWQIEKLGIIRSLIKLAEPDVIEEIKWRRPNNPDGVIVWSLSGIICTGEIYKNHLRITFHRGAFIDDPDRLFNSGTEGRTFRAIVVKEEDRINEPAFINLVRRAILLNSKKK